MYTFEASRKVTFIEQSPEVDSLNLCVAASIALYQMTR